MIDRCLAHHFLRVPRHRDRLSQPTRVKVTVRFLRQHPRQGRRIVRLDGTLMASTDWQAAITALKAGELPSSSGERRMLLLAASIAGGIPVSLYDTLPGIHRNASLVIKAIAHATGHTNLKADTE